MSAINQPLGHRRSDQSRAAQYQHAHRIFPKDIVKAALISGSSASIASTLVVTLFSAARRGAPAAGTNTSSQWIWGKKVRRHEQVSAKHTLTGYAIHHASSLLWAGCFEAWAAKSTRPAELAAKAAATAAVAYVVDYKIVPPRLSPGFEGKVGRVGMAAVYAAFAGGLLAARAARARRKNTVARAAGQSGQRA